MVANSLTSYLYRHILSLSVPSLHCLMDNTNLLMEGLISLVVYNQASQERCWELNLVMGRLTI